MLDGATWRLTLSCGAEGHGARETVEEEASVVVACGGLRGDTLEALHRAPPFAIKPRRGDFVLFDQATSAAALEGDAPLGQVPSATSRGVYVWKSVHGVLACGPTAEDVDERVTPPRATDARVRGALAAAAAATVPALGRARVAGTYAGLRPGSDASKDYQIERVAGKPWVTVGGIRSTGLTASLGIARHVANLCEEAVAQSGASVGSLDVAAGPPKTTPLPSLEAIYASYATRGDGSIVFGDDEMGFGPHHVTHPLTREGLARRSREKNPRVGRP